jgi:hypothetical protein
MEDVNNVEFNYAEIERDVETWMSQEEIHPNPMYKSSFESTYNKKILSNNWDALVSWSVNLGNNHFAITINMPINEDYYIYDNFNQEWYDRLEKVFKLRVIECFPTTTYFFIVGEKNKQGILHFHCLLAMRNFIDYDLVLRNSILLSLKDLSSFGFRYSISDMDIRVDPLRYFKDIKNWVMYMYKDMHSWKFAGKLYVLEMYRYDPFKTHLIDVMSSFLEIKCRIKSLKEEKHKADSIVGVRLTYNTINNRTLINLLQYYLILNNYFIYNNSIYKKIENTKISYAFVGTITEVLYDRFQENVSAYYLMNYPKYFNTFDFNYLITTYLVKGRAFVQAIKDISTQKINPDFSLMEFNDGVYSLKYNRFFSNRLKHNFNGNMATLKYYDKSYNRVRQDKPINWINGLRHALNIKEKEDTDKDYNNICLYMVYPIHKNIFDKKSTLFVYGVSNTGKTTLVGTPVQNYFGSENVGWVVSTKNFKWQHLENKRVAIIDEGKYNPSMSSDILKLSGGEAGLLIEKKYSKEHISLDSMVLFILSNNKFKDEDERINEALRKRMCTIEFKNPIKENDLLDSRGFKKHLKDEEANIIIYCNKMLFKIRKELKNKKIKDNDILKLLHGE